MSPSAETEMEDTKPSVVENGDQALSRFSEFSKVNTFGLIFIFRFLGQFF